MTDSNQDKVRLVGPRDVYARPLFYRQPRIDLPGRLSQMNPVPDHREQMLQGIGKLRGLSPVAIVELAER
ncbi:hypothetical protein [Roseiconus lacunae]|uniref:Uncharacterized protein n=1 Tax=Roseiconus lacunae TaxID=2605694 RepID=A0ABT7PNG5_9BACT|nr:hypothetical protein [Roseiconus lacunae]MDM4017831.1 hypothetical protein [Roseiconus lacunae]